MRSIKRFALRNLRVVGFVLLSALLLFLVCIAIVGIHFFRYGLYLSWKEARELGVFAGVSALVIGLLMRDRSRSPVIGRRREAIGLAAVVPLALLASVLQHLTGETWVVFPVVCIGIPTIMAWTMLGDQMPTKEERRRRKLNP